MFAHRGCDARPHNAATINSRSESHLLPEITSRAATRDSPSLLSIGAVNTQRRPLIAPLCRERVTPQHRGRREPGVVLFQTSRVRSERLGDQHLNAPSFACPPLRSHAHTASRTP